MLLTITVTTKLHGKKNSFIPIYEKGVYTCKNFQITLESASQRNSLKQCMHQFLFQEIQKNNIKKDLPGNNPTLPCGFVPCHQSSDAGSISVIVSPSLKEISLSSAAS